MQEAPTGAPSDEFGRIPAPAQSRVDEDAAGGVLLVLVLVLLLELAADELEEGSTKDSARLPHLVLPEFPPGAGHSNEPVALYEHNVGTVARCWLMLVLFVPVLVPLVPWVGIKTKCRSRTRRGEMSSTGDLDECAGPPVDVTGIFWEFCKRASSTPSDSDADGLRGSDEYDEMYAAVHSGRPLSLTPTPPVRMPSAIVGAMRELPKGCTWDAEEASYVFADVEALFEGVALLLDPWATTHRKLVGSCVARIKATVDAEDLADAWGAAPGALLE